jgi:Glyoxalase/Bleomycin resistance protein/Dioxygenase superfamily
MPDAAPAALPEGSYTQTAFVVRNVEAAAARWSALAGAGPWYVLETETTNTIYRGRPSDDAYRLGMAFAGGSLIELIQPLDREPSILNEVLALRGEGFHHVCPNVSGLSGPSFDERCRELEGRGLHVAMTTDVVGLGRAAFYDALDSIGGFIEVFELGDAYPMVPLMAQAHLAWDGSDPVREIASLFATAR